ncbi:hypothetical protein [Geoalkalibacter halelectricus]|uniref:Uncharacterized protein n=1 Tax=Geoalkalibacter halelectricus TaxID=2847045 RepID=A0ABY5ZIS8_9BACT|nr:hypothetical protein [Geoalkalibacter halelectricus]MDO3378929.1 hypothetical protein [Geoalkalibacter halelectricus]UWZ79048.1 hypothetical protein L9S41_15385 [Geoalkalibacter halelectricus]
MLSVGILFSELAAEAPSPMLDRIWPFFLMVVLAAAGAALYFALRADKSDPAEKDAHDD